ncbi:MAG: hypothetical protein HC780_28155 [Leptolyngbyaceae cyanobacterium CSU_1_3]|nr:hypothetical protein [Leptolyngbyaceae cyanobacterium CSU_1_3]
MTQDQTTDDTKQAVEVQILMLFAMLPHHRQKAVLLELEPEPSFHGDFFE